MSARKLDGRRYLESAYRENVLEHLFVGELLRELWVAGRHAELLHAEVDDAGYDVVVDCEGVIRHVQLKSSFEGARTARFNVQLRLGEKPSGCVVWIIFDRDTLEFRSFRFFGGEPGEKLPDIRRFPIARHTNGDASGKKAERPNLRVVTKAKFQEVSEMRELVNLLIGDE